MRFWAVIGVVLSAVALAGDGTSRRGGDESAVDLDIRPLAILEQQRAVQLRHQLDGLIAPGVSDLELLGIKARSAAERRRYAEHFVRRYRALTQAVLDFESEVQAAHRRLFDAQPVLADDKWYRSGYRWTLRPGGRADRQAILQRVLAAAGAGHQSQIRLLTDDRRTAMDWVRRHLPAGDIRRSMFRVSLADTGEEGLHQLPVLDEQP